MKELRLKEKIGLVIREAIGWIIAGIGSYLIYFKGFTLINCLILFAGLMGILLHFPYRIKMKE